MRILLGTPMLNGICHMEYMESVLALQSALNARGIIMDRAFLKGDSIIQRARNIIVDYFLKTEATHLLFVDADNNFRPDDILKMIDADKDIILAAIQMKTQHFLKFTVERFDREELNLNEPCKIKRGGTGCMLIKKEVFEKLKPKTKTFKSDSQLNQVSNFFRVEVRDGILVSEDQLFCDSYRDIGGSVWLAPWAEVGHIGSYNYNVKYTGQ